MHILFTSGGSIGHIAPLIAVWEELQKLVPNATAHVLCSSDAEVQYCEEKGLHATALPRPRRNLLLPWTFLSAYCKARAFLHKKAVDVVFSKGGAVSVPVCIAAHHKNIPIVLHESDTIMGRANQFISSYAHAVCCGFKSDDSRGVVTGNPVQKKVLQGSREQGLDNTRLSGKKPILLVMGGSQGAVAINTVITNQLDALLKHCDIIHLTGKGKKTHDSQSGYFAAEFITEELPHFYAAATIAMGRSGNGFLNEMAANGIPSILVPLEGLAQNHQYHNAVFAAEHGGCTLLRQTDLEENLLSIIKKLLNNPTFLKQKRTEIHRLYKPHAARDIAAIIQDTVASSQKST